MPADQRNPISDRDALLDAALRQYSAAQPRPGLEQRMLAAVRAAEREQAQSAPKLLDWRWLGAVAAVLVLVAALIVLRREGSHNTPAGMVRTNPKVESAPAPSSRQNTVAAAPGVAKPPRRAQPERQASAVAGHSAQEAPLPHLAVFPTPVEPTRQDATLAYFANNADPKVLTALAAASNGPTLPLSIEPIRIEPLASPGEPAGDEQQAQDAPKF